VAPSPEAVRGWGWPGNGSRLATVGPSNPSSRPATRSGGDARWVGAERPGQQRRADSNRIKILERIRRDSQLQVHRLALQGEDAEDNRGPVSGSLRTIAQPSTGELAEGDDLLWPSPGSAGGTDSPRRCGPGRR
jgi:hypothetical protein